MTSSIRPRDAVASRTGSSRMGSSGTGTALVLAALRIALHVMFAGLLALGAVQMLSSGGSPVLRGVGLGFAGLLGILYLAGTVVEKRRHDAVQAPLPQTVAVGWLAAVLLCWVLLVLHHRGFAWLMFPLAFVVQQVILGPLDPGRLGAGPGPVGARHGPVGARSGPVGAGSGRWEAEPGPVGARLSRPERGHTHREVLRGLAALAVVGAMVAVVIAAYGPDAGVGVVIGPLVGGVATVVMHNAYRVMHAEATALRRALIELQEAREELAAQERRAGVLAERARISRDIHDTLTQGFASIVLLARAARANADAQAEAGVQADGRGSTVGGGAADGTGHAESGGQAEAGGGPSAGSDPLRAMEEVAVENLRQSRAVVRDLREEPSRSLADLIGSAARAAQRRAAADGQTLRIRTHLPEDLPRLPLQVETTILRSIQTALANVVEHAGATTAVVTVALMENGIAVDIYDDGRGMDPALLETPARTASHEAGSVDDHARSLGDTGAGSGTASGGAGSGSSIASGRGMGLRSIRERVDALGGSAAVESGPGRGTVLTLHLPLACAHVPGSAAPEPGVPDPGAPEPGVPDPAALEPEALDPAAPPAPRREARP